MINAEKSLLRMALLAARKAVPNPLEAAELTAQKALEFIIELKANIIALYVPFGAELSTLPLAQKLRSLNKTLTLPVVETPNSPLIFKQWLPDTPLIKGICKTYEPPIDAKIVMPDVIITPLVGFDKNGYRLGMGGGYYDRTMAALRAHPSPPKFIGIGFDCQEMPKIPIDKFDQTLNAIITPIQILNIF